MRFLYWNTLLFILWLLLTQNLQIANILIGIAISSSLTLLYTKLFPTKEFKVINPYWLFIYILILIKNLIISNIQIAKRTLSKDMKLAPAIVGVKTELKSDWKKLLLANSITLTPGTLTLDIIDDTLFIHIIEYHEGEDKQNITKEFEEIILKI